MTSQNSSGSWSAIVSPIPMSAAYIPGCPSAAFILRMMSRRNRPGSLPISITNGSLGISISASDASSCISNRPAGCPTSMRIVRSAATASVGRTMSTGSSLGGGSLVTSKAASLATAMGRAASPTACPSIEYIARTVRATIGRSCASAARWSTPVG
jgi:hypothetical protein